MSPKFEEETEHENDNIFPDPHDVVAKKVKVEEPVSAESSASTGGMFPEPAPPTTTGLPKKAELALAAEVDADEDENDKRALCKYHPNCYRKNLDHWKQFRHPGKAPPTSMSSSTSALPPTVPHDPVPPAGKKTAVKSSGSKGSSGFVHSALVRELCFCDSLNHFLLFNIVPIHHQLVLSTTKMSRNSHNNQSRRSLLRPQLTKYLLLLQVITPEVSQDRRE